MTLPANGSISLGINVDVELGLSNTTQISLGGTSVRNLYGISSGAIRLAADGYGKSISNVVFRLYNTPQAIQYPTEIFENSTGIYTIGPGSPIASSDAQGLYMVASKLTLAGSHVFTKQSVAMYPGSLPILNYIAFTPYYFQSANSSLFNKMPGDCSLGSVVADNNGNMFMSFNFVSPYTSIAYWNVYTGFIKFNNSGQVTGSASYLFAANTNSQSQTGAGRLNIRSDGTLIYSWHDGAKNTGTTYPEHDVVFISNTLSFGNTYRRSTYGSNNYYTTNNQQYAPVWAHKTWMDQSSNTLYIGSISYSYLVTTGIRPCLSVWDVSGATPTCSNSGSLTFTANSYLQGLSYNSYTNKLSLAGGYGTYLSGPNMLANTFYMYRGDGAPATFLLNATAATCSLPAGYWIVIYDVASNATHITVAGMIRTGGVYANNGNHAQAIVMDYNISTSSFSNILVAPEISCITVYHYDTSNNLWIGADSNASTEATIIKTTDSGRNATLNWMSDTTTASAILSGLATGTPTVSVLNYAGGSGNVAVRSVVSAASQTFNSSTLTSGWSSY